jgi:hypothetical protein
MSIAFAEMRVGNPIHHGRLSVFPLFAGEHLAVEYQLADEALGAGTVTVAEISQQGSVPELAVENHATTRVLFLEGEELRGAKQNRILNTTVAVPAQAKLTLPVSCVEQGRWRRTSTTFSSSKCMSPHSLRHSLKSSVTYSLKAKRGHHSNQGQVWEEVSKQQRALDVSSDTGALSDTYAKFDERLNEAQAAMQYVEGASGLAVAIGSRLVSADWFDKPATCAKVWGRLMSGLVLETLGDEEAPESPPQAAAVEGLLRDIGAAEWSPTDTVGEGQEFRAEFNSKFGSALVLEGSLVHGSVLMDRNASD